MTELFFDIETVPSNDPKVREILAEKINPPGNMSKPETIAKWEAEEKPKLIDEAMAKTSLDGTYGRICCISYAFDDDPVVGIIDRDETRVLTEFFNVCREESNTSSRTSSPSRVALPLTAIGHAVYDFDLRFVWQRAVINRVKPPMCLPFNASKYSEHIKDTMTMWNPAPDKRISLHRLCLALGLESPKDQNGITGADIALLWKKREYEKIKTYAMDDVADMRRCYRRMTA